MDPTAEQDLGTNPDGGPAEMSPWGESQPGPSPVGSQAGDPRSSGVEGLRFRRGVLRVTRRSMLLGAASVPVLGRFALGASATINAVRMAQGGVSRAWSTIYGDTRAHGFPISANQIFMNIAVAIRNSMPQGYPGVYTIAGIYDALGEPVFQVRLLPPSAAIPNSISNPSLQVLMTAGSQAG